MKIPKIAIAATGSGRGKTTIVCALVCALKRRGLDVRAFKCGPDYIDPLFHRRALGTPSKNLDLFFTDAETTRRLFELENDSEISIVEGVMGLYDGFSPTSDAGSSYRLACALDAPVALIVDARGMGRSVLAEIRGFLDMDEERRIAGVILNRMSPSYFKTIKPIIERELGVAVLGYFPNAPELAIESRYLGLKLPNEMEDLRAKIDRAADAIAKSVDLNALLELAGYSSERVKPSLKTELNALPPFRARIAVALDDAFCFYYEDNLRLLREHGAELVPFSPLVDAAPPSDVDGYLFGGGYPELYARRLSENETLLDALRGALVDDKTPCLAECGGFMYLHERLTTESGEEFHGVGVVPGATRYVGKLVRFGYAEFREKAPRFLAGARNSIRGHEFHYYDSDSNGEDCVATKPTTGRNWDCARVDEDRWLGFPHLYYPSNPDFPRRFVERCAAFRKRRLERADDGKLQ